MSEKRLLCDGRNFKIPLSPASVLLLAGFSQKYIFSQPENWISYTQGYSRSVFYHLETTVLWAWLHYFSENNNTILMQEGINVLSL